MHAVGIALLTTMDLYGSDLRLSDIGLADEQLDREYPLDMLDQHMTSSNPYHSAVSIGTSSGSHGSISATNETNLDLMDFPLAAPLDNNWLDTFLDDSVFQDAFISDTFQPQHVKSEHSYSMSNGSTNISHHLTDDTLTFDVKLETDKDMETEFFGTAIDPDLTLLTDAHTDLDDLATDIITPDSINSKPPTFEDQQQQELTYEISNGVECLEAVNTEDEEDEMIECIKIEPQDSEDCLSEATYTTVDSDVYNLISLPPTPPSSSGSSSSSSDSEAGGLTPTRSNPPSPHNSPYSRQVSIRHSQNLWTATIQQQPTFTNPISSSGTFFLTEEEKRTLIAEGYPVPNKLPLSKQEEKNLKKIRRKIKNKISAQESRRKKKEYLESLEKKVETVSQENSHLKKKVDILETNNRSLMSQLHRLQSMLNKLGATSTTANTAACVTVN